MSFNAGTQGQLTIAPNTSNFQATLDASAISANRTYTLPNSSGTLALTAGLFTNPMTTLGDMIYEDVTPAAARLAGNTTTTRMFLRQTGTGAVSAAPAWDTVTKADVGLGSVTNNAQVTSVGATSPITTSGGTTPTISTLMNTNKLIGRGTAGTGVMEEITLGTNLSLSGTTLNASSGGTPGGSTTQIQYNNSGAFGGIPIDYLPTGGNIPLIAEAQTVANTDGNNIYFQGALGKGTGKGGDFDIAAGWDEGDIGFGGELFLAGSPTTGKPADTYLAGAYGVDGDGGDLVLLGGIKSGSGTLDGVVKVKDANSNFSAILSTLLLGTSDKTFTFNNATGGFVVANGNATTTAPSTTATPVFASYYGGNTKALGDPVAWIAINIAGTTYKIPLYT